MEKIVFAAGLLAKELHKGQTDKGGHDYFCSHLLKVASSGCDWKEKVVGFLHDASEDCDITVEEIIERLDSEIARVIDTPKVDWWEDWMNGVLLADCAETHMITEGERNEIKTTLNLLNHDNASSREEYIDRISKNLLALEVKMHDLENNMDLTRISHPTEKDLARLDRYKSEYQKLLNALHNDIKNH